MGLESHRKLGLQVYPYGKTGKPANLHQAVQPATRRCRGRERLPPTASLVYVSQRCFSLSVQQRLQSGMDAYGRLS